jgi:hypothetical protein
LNDYLGAAAPSVELDCTENNSGLFEPGQAEHQSGQWIVPRGQRVSAMNTEFNSVMWWDLRNGQETGNNNSASLYGWRLYGDYGVVDSADPANPVDR